MFYEWVTKGAQIGIEAFFALFTFGLFVLAGVGMVALGGRIMGGEHDKDRRR